MNTIIDTKKESLDVTSRVNSDKLSRRPIIESDQDFLLQLYATTRQDILDSPLSEPEKTSLIFMQFVAQHQHYQSHFSNAQFEIIQLEYRAVGRLYVDTNEQEIRIIDIALMPEERGKGIGTFLVMDQLEKAKSRSLPVRLRVEPENPAVRLYKRAGFSVIAEEPTNLHMQWGP